MKNLNMLAIDLGASSGRGIVGSFDGNQLTLRENHRFSNDPVTVGKHFRWDILRILHEIKQSIREVGLSGEEITGMGIDTWGVDYGLIDRHGELLSNPIHYRDTRTAGMAKALSDVLPADELYGITGIQTIDFNTVYQLAADLRDNPEMVKNSVRMLNIPDLLNYFLTGEMANEYTICSTGAILNAKTRKVAPEIFERLGLPMLVGDVVEPGNCLGRLSKAVSEELGGVNFNVYNVASHDTASAVLAVPAKEEDFVYISSGTWSLMGTELTSPLVSNESLAWNFANEGGALGTYRFLKNIMGLWTVQESRRQWKREGKDYSFADLQTMAEVEKPLVSFINPDDPLFATPGDMPGRIVEFCRKTGQHVPENEGQIVRVIMESLALRYRYVKEGIEALRGKPVRGIHIVGGGTKDTFLCGLAADACGIPVTAGPVEATAIGNLLMQYIAAGELKNLSEARELVIRSFEPVLYTPAADRAAFDEAYVRFCKICEKSC
ncbi:MAG: rhamnulokinase [Clostridia bacterium]|nr:rhamnulokinase [Clostridia bacterium]